MGDDANGAYFSRVLQIAAGVAILAAVVVGGYKLATMSQRQSNDDPQPRQLPATDRREIRVGDSQYKYDRQNPISSGADGFVFFARSDEGGEVAIKEAKEQGRNALANESNVLDRLGGQPNVVQKLAFDPTGNGTLVIAKYAGSLNNADVLNSMPVERRAAYAQGVLDAVGAMHGLNITHNDINLKNMLFADDASSSGLKMADFGSANAFDGATEMTRPPTPEEQVMIDNGIITADDLKVTKADAQRRDRKDALKAAFNLLCRVPNDIEPVADSYQASLRAALDGKPADQVNTIVGIFDHYMQGEYRTEDLAALKQALGAVVG